MVQISTNCSPIERRVGLACKIAKLKTGGILVNAIIVIPQCVSAIYQNNVDKLR